MEFASHYSKLLNEKKKRDHDFSTKIRHQDTIINNLKDEIVKIRERQNDQLFGSSLKSSVAEMAPQRDNSGELNISGNGFCDTPKKE